MAATVDIVVRTKDRPILLRRALRSIAGQTFTDWRIVLVNDGGDPAVVEGLLREEGVEDRTLVIDHATSAGRWPSANAGVRAGDAPLLVLHDDDDTWDPRFLEAATSYLAEHPDAVGVVSRETIVWERLEGSAYVETGREVFQPNLTAPLLADVLLFNRFVPIGFLYRRSLHDELGEYREDLAVVGDWEFNLRILTQHPLEFLGDEPLAYWHQRPSSTGVDGNSVIENSGHHRHYDAWVRDAALREQVQREGNGDVLYLTKFIDRRFLDLEHFVGAEVERRVQDRLDRLEASLAHQVWESSTIHRVKKLSRRLLRRV